jgi:SpoVK/Ycf46/Vps4 family AAA+-type ATPase
VLAGRQALCAEASLAALRRVYPQIYTSDVKLLIDVSAVRVTRADFAAAMKGKLQTAFQEILLYVHALLRDLRAQARWT